MQFPQKAIIATIFSVLDNPALSTVMHKIVYKIRRFIVVNPHFFNDSSTPDRAHFEIKNPSITPILVCNKNVIFLDFLAKVEISTFAKVEICEKVLKTLI